MSALFWFVVIAIAIGGTGVALAQTVTPDPAPADPAAADQTLTISDISDPFSAIVSNITDPLVIVASNAGFEGSDLITAVAVALAESGGNPKAYNPEVAAGTPAGRGSFGLWQIYRKAHPEFDGWDLFDPQQNATAAFQVFTAAGDSFSPWSTFKSGAYQAHLAAAQDRVNA